MRASWIIPVLNLIFVLIEICDPTSPFIRVSSEPIHPPVAQHSLQYRERFSEKENCKPSLLQAKKKTHASKKALQGSASETHYATRMPFANLKTMRVQAVWQMRDHSLQDQFEPCPLIRPPISLA